MYNSIHAVVLIVLVIYFLYWRAVPNNLYFLFSPWVTETFWPQFQDKIWHISLESKTSFRLVCFWLLCLQLCFRLACYWLLCLQLCFRLACYWLLCLQLCFRLACFWLCLQSCDLLILCFLLEYGVAAQWAVWSKNRELRGLINN